MVYISTTCFYNVVDTFSGSTMDWAKEKLGIKYSFCPELRPESGTENGFVRPPEEIVPTGEEVWAGLYALVRAIEQGQGY